jgi:biopolymer transport protein ExbD
VSTDTSNQPTSDESSAPDDEILMLRRRRRKEAVPGGLNLVAMMDMLTILLVYLITQVADMPGASAANIDLASSSVKGKVLPGTTVMVSVPSPAVGTPGSDDYRDARTGGVSIDNTLACTAEEISAAGVEKACLRKALSRVFSEKKALAEALGDTAPTYDLLIIADTTAPYHWVYSVIASANVESFTSYRLVVKSADAAAAGGAP